MTVNTISVTRTQWVQNLSLSLYALLHKERRKQENSFIYYKCKYTNFIKSFHERQRKFSPVLKGWLERGQRLSLRKKPHGGDRGQQVQVGLGEASS